MAEGSPGRGLSASRAKQVGKLVYMRYRTLPLQLYTTGLRVHVQDARLAKHSVALATTSGAAGNNGANFVVRSTSPRELGQQVRCRDSGAQVHNGALSDTVRSSAASSSAVASKIEKRPLIGSWQTAIHSLGGASGCERAVCPMHKAIVIGGSKWPTRKYSGRNLLTYCYFSSSSIIIRQ